MRRREFVLGAGALAAGGAGLFWHEQQLEAAASYPGREQGHWLRDAQALPPPTETLDTEVLIAGSGIAGLTAAWQLAKHGVHEVLRVPGPELYGNAAAGRDGDLTFPTGAHYLPLLSRESVHLREMLGDFGIIQADPFTDRPTFDERYLVHAPAERVLFKGTWQDGYLPADGVGAAERAQHDRFFAWIEEFSTARGADGRRAFVVPLELSSGDERFRALDRLTFKAWLDARGLTAPTLHWYLDYCCRDDYGRHYDEVSAWAGLHYFCSRNAGAANAERGAVLTWPEGLSALATRLDAAAAGQHQLAGSVARLRVVPGGVEALCVTQEPGTLGGSGAWRTTRVTARHAIAAMPLFVLQHVLVDAAGHGFEPARDVPRYAPWMVSNFILRAFPEERGGAPRWRGTTSCTASRAWATWCPRTRTSAWGRRAAPHSRPITRSPTLRRRPRATGCSTPTSRHCPSWPRATCAWPMAGVCRSAWSAWPSRCVRMPWPCPNPASSLIPVASRCAQPPGRSSSHTPICPACRCSRRPPGGATAPPDHC